MMCRYGLIKSLGKSLTLSYKPLMVQPSIHTRKINSARLTTTASNAVHKLQMAVEQYRVINYSQELPSRCKKEIIQAANVNKNTHIEAQNLVQILHNIGAEEIVSESDLRSIISEIGDKQNHTISVDELIKIL